MKKENQQSDIIICTTDDGQPRLQVKIKDETVWLTQKQMAELFQCSTDNVELHLKNIFKEGELNENSVTEEYSVTASDGKGYDTPHYNFDAIAPFEGCCKKLYSDLNYGENSVCREFRRTGSD
jgi:hypothetical protein